MNAGGLWARRVGAMVGVDHPLVPMPHHYLVTDDIPEVAAIPGEMVAVTDLEGFTYLQREGNGVLLGVYEQNPRHWQVEGAEWDFGRTLFPEELDRIMPELSIGFARFPVLADTGIKKWVNGAFTFTPDGNPLVGPVGGRPQLLGRVRLHGRVLPGRGDRAGARQLDRRRRPRLRRVRHGRRALRPLRGERRYLRDTTKQFYARRFVMAYPNEELPAGRPLKTTPVYDEFLAAGAQFTVNWGLEVPLYFAPSPDFVENDTLSRSNAEPIVGEEVEAVRTAAGAYEIAQYARYEVAGPDAARLAGPPAGGHASRPSGRIRLAPMLNEAGAADGRPHGGAARRRPLLAHGLLLPAGLAPAVVRAAPAARPA